MIKKLFIFLLTSSFLFALASCEETQIDIDKPRIKSLSIIESYSKAGAVDIFVESLESNCIIYYLILEESDITLDAEYIKNNATGSSDTGVLYLTSEGLSQNISYDVFCVLEKENEFSEIYKTTVFTSSDYDVLDKGQGTVEDPYRIYTVEDLEAIGTFEESYTSHYLLMNDLDLSQKYGEDKESFLPIGYQLGSREDFYGSIDGGGHTIKGLYIDESQSTKEGVGFVAALQEGGIVKNIVFEDSVVIGAVQRLGTIVGYNKGTVGKCAVINGYVEQVGGGNRTGGAIGQSYTAGIIYQLYVDATVVSNGEETGGVVGCTTSSSGQDSIVIKDCYFIGSVITEKRRAAGIIGKLESGYVESCYSMATITSSADTASGIVGYSEYKYETALTYIKNCFTINSNITATSSLGYILAASSTSTWTSSLGEDVSKQALLENCFVVNSTISDETSKYDANYNSDEDVFEDIPTKNVESLIDIEFLETYFTFDISSDTSVWVLLEGASRPVLRWAMDLDDGVII